MRNRKAVFAFALCLFVAGAALAQEPAGPPKPAAEHKALDYFVGEWSGKAEMKPGPWGAGGPMTWTDKCHWLGEAGFNVVCKSEGTGPMGPVVGLSILGYDPGKKVYTFYGVDTTGWSGRAEGTVAGEVWTYTSEDTVGAMTFKGRYTLTRVSPTEQSFKYETSMDGTSWMAMMEGASTKSTKKK